MAKIAMNYLAYQEPGIAHLAVCSQTRGFIRWGSKVLDNPVEIIPSAGGSGLDGRPEHFLTLYWNAREKALTAEVCLLGGFLYRVRLGTGFTVEPIHVRYGHKVDPLGKVLQPLNWSPA